MNSVLPIYSHKHLFTKRVLGDTKKTFFISELVYNIMVKIIAKNGFQMKSYIVKLATLERFILVCGGAFLWTAFKYMIVNKNSNRFSTYT